MLAAGATRTHWATRRGFAMRRTIYIAAALVLAVTLSIAPAQAAGAARTFVAAAGNDANNCTNVATPCRHLAAAYAATSPNGEIYVLDPANYGSLIITGPVSIEGHGWASIAPPGTDIAAINVNANPGDKINIIGVVLDGTGIGNTIGIRFNSGGTLTVRDSVIRNFTDKGIYFTPDDSGPTQVFVSNTLLSDNNFGITIGSHHSGTTTGVFDHVEIAGNGQFGLYVVPDQNANITVADSVIVSNGASGIYAGSDPFLINVMVRDSTIANNGIDGFDVSGNDTTIRVTRSTITGNGGSGWHVYSGVMLSYGDNNIDGNGSANTEPPNPLAYK
jgi:Right handed beta helix region